MDDNQYIFGIRAIEEAIAANQHINKIVARKGLSGDLFAHLQEVCKSKQIRIQYTTPDVLDRITKSNHQGVIAFISQIKYVNLSDIAHSQNQLLVALDGITDVRNFGAIARSADCAGVQALIVPSKGSAPINGESIKTSAGALNHIPVCQTNNLFMAIKALKESGLRVVGATEHGADDYYNVDFTQPTVIIMGSEDKGISKQLLKLCDANAKIPMTGHIESLNVSVAAGIIMFEAVRQRALIK
ncbi:MAG: 23S rRNA (guanosine(2251)-2'-O)-methyltransferase RlmB [Bacteroidales bacterium]|nr:23S rRNA (guanosine(2251)-2'-O)-methyltransferase RlmB [Bacteroidales bacterium]